MDFLEDGASFVSDSLFSVESDGSATVEEDVVDLNELFASSSDNPHTSRSHQQEKATPSVGKVLSGFQSSFLNHSFKLHSIIHASFSVLGLSCGSLREGEQTREGV